MVSDFELEVSNPGMQGEQGKKEEDSSQLE